MLAVSPTLAFSDANIVGITRMPWGLLPWTSLRDEWIMEKFETVLRGRTESAASEVPNIRRKKSDGSFVPARNVDRN